MIQAMLAKMMLVLKAVAIMLAKLYQKAGLNRSGVKMLSRVSLRLMQRVLREEVTSLIVMFVGGGVKAYPV